MKDIRVATDSIVGKRMIVAIGNRVRINSAWLSQKESLLPGVDCLIAAHELLDFSGECPEETKAISDAIDSIRKMT